MISNILSIIVILSSIVGPYDSEVTINNSESSANYDINIIDSDTIKVDNYYFDANDFSIPSNMISEENIDLLSEVTIWNSITGETVDYDYMTFDDDSVTYTFKGSELTVNYNLLYSSNTIIRDVSKIIISSFSDNIVKIIISTILISLIIVIILISIKKIFSNTIQNIFKLLFS